MTRVIFCSRILRTCAGVATIFLSALSAACAEKVDLHMPGGTVMRCEVLKVTKSDVSVRPENGKEQTLPFGLLKPQEVYECYTQSLEPKTAALRFDIGVFLIKKALFNEAKIELTEAAKLDESFKGRVADLLKTLPGKSEAVKVSTSEPKKTPDKPVANADKPKTPQGPASPKMDDGKGSDAAYAVEQAMKDNDFQRRFIRREIPPRSDAKMKEFLDKRLEELNTTIGGKWRLIETKHYYCFSDLPEQTHTFVANQWNEPLYDMLCKILQHKDGEKLWNNKMPVYYFETYRQFQHFAVDIDKSPGGAYSGGYFASQGRDVHICIPFMSERLKSNENRMKEMARSTLCHEGTHAFLQLSGEDVPLSKWLHEGMAQFIEFLFDTDKNPDKKETIARLKAIMQMNKGNPPSWDETHDRPMGGTDLEGYCCAYAKLEFLYRNFNNQCLPQMIHMIKSGKTETEAMETVFKHKVGMLEDYYRAWVKDAVKSGFNFPAPQ